MQDIWDDVQKHAAQAVAWWSEAFAASNADAIVPEQLVSHSQVAAELLHMTGIQGEFFRQTNLVLHRGCLGKYITTT